MLQDFREDKIISDTRVTSDKLWLALLEALNKFI